MIRRFIVAACMSLLVVGAWTACVGDDPATAVGRGAQSQPCFDNGTCLNPLVCTNGLCGPDRDSGASSSSTSTSASSSSGSSSSSSSASSSASSSSSSSSTSSSGDGGGSSSSSGSTPAQDAAKAACENQKRCFPTTFAAGFGTVAACTTETTSTASFATFPGLDPACTTKQITGACGEYPLECFRGTLAANAVCNYGSQCASGYCSKAAATDACGKCGPTKNENDACGASDYSCGAIGGGLRCDFAVGKCVKSLASGADCSAAGDAANCTFPDVCFGDVKKCGRPRDINGSCGTFSADCRNGLDCAGGKCEDIAPTYKNIGDTCSASEVCRGKSSCVSGKCVAYATKGADCALDGTKAQCDPYAGLSCNAGKCASTNVQVCK